MHVIGTAGHIDHGKSTLIRALTGINPDRLREEQARGLTIDLGFAWITLPSGREAGIVDVPGHQRFVKNMLAGVTGIDLALFVVAATESWMPQSQEHLDILELLGVKRGLIVLTKVDLVEPDWLEMVQEDVRERVRGTFLEDAPIMLVSAVDGTGLDELRARIDEILAEVPERPDNGRARLWVDRVFTVRGAGTVVTGTLAGGSLRLEQEVVVLPRSLRARVRSIQTHQRQVEVATPGSRVALNLTGLEREQMERGDVVAAPGFLQASSVLRTWVRLLPESPRALPRVTQGKVHVGTAERMATVRLLDRDVLEPGGEALADLHLDEPVAVEIGDPFVLREPGVQATLGGGKVLDPKPLLFSRRRWKRRTRAADKERAGARPVRTVWRGERSQRVLPAALWVDVPEPDPDLLRARAGADPADLPALLLQERWVMSEEQLRREVPVAAAVLEETLARLEEGAKVVRLPSFVWDAGGWESWWAHVEGDLTAYHRKHPLRAGEDRETLRSRLGADSRLFEESVQRWVQEGRLRAVGTLVALPDHQVSYSEEQRREIQRLWTLLDGAGYEPPDLDALTTEHGFDQALISSLVEAGELVIIAGGFVYRREILDAIEKIVRDFIAAHGSIDVAQLRDALGSSRRYALPLLGHFDQVGVTRRVGDKRILAPVRSSSSPSPASG